MNNKNNKINMPPLTTKELKDIILKKVNKMKKKRYFKSFEFN